MDCDQYVEDYIKFHDVKEIIEYNNRAHLLSEYDELTLRTFVKDFWDNPKANIVKLKSKFKVNPSISYADIVASYPIDKYLSFLQDVWCSNPNFNEICIKYNIDLKRISDIILKIPYIDDKVVCPECLNSSEFNIEFTDLKNPYKILTCNECKKVIDNIDELVDIKEAENIRAKRKKELDNYNMLVELAERKLSETSCHKCSNYSLELLANRSTKSYKIRCNNCNSLWDSMISFEKENAEFKQRSAMMIAIKERNKEAETLSELKNQPLIHETIITYNDAIKVVDKYREYEERGEISSLLHTGIKNTNRLEKLLLISLIQIIKEKNETSDWKYNNKVVINVLGNSKFEYPIVDFIAQKTKYLNVRETIKNLMLKDLVICAEDRNFIQLHPKILDFESVIKQLLSPQNIKNDIKYLIFKRHDYTCWHCGETGRSLKIGFLNNDKDINKIDTIVAICDVCHNCITKNDVIIAATSSITPNDNSYSPSYRLLIDYLPELNGQTYIMTNLEDMSEIYGEDNLVKALAVSINKVKKGELTSIKSLLDYTYGVLKQANGEVKPQGKITEEYKLNKYLSN